jgi:hypothetical protein
MLNHFGAMHEIEAPALLGCLNKSHSAKPGLRVSFGGAGDAVLTYVNS